MCARLVNIRPGAVSVHYFLGASNLNFALDEGALVPLSVVTLTAAVPAASAGVSTVIDVPEEESIVASAEPNLTAVTPVKLLPVIVTLVPPAVVPFFGKSFLIVGSGASNTYAAPASWGFAPAPARCRGAPARIMFPEIAIDSPKLSDVLPSLAASS